MAIEVGRPPEVVGVPFTTRFAESSDLKSWKILPEDRAFTGMPGPKNGWLRSKI